MARQETTQVVQSPLLPPKVDRTVEELRVLLSGGRALAEDAIRVAARDKQLEAQRTAAATRLEQQVTEQQAATQMQGIENQLGQERMRYRATGELLEVLQEDIKALEENERNGALALLGRTADKDLPKAAADLGIHSPENLIEIDREIGARQAMNHYPLVLKSFLTDPSKTPREHLADWFSKQTLNSPEQETGYVTTLTRLIRQDEESSIRERVRAGNIVGLENSVFRIEREAALKAAEWAADPSKLDAALKDFHAEAMKFNPALSNQDVATVFREAILPQLLGRMTSRQQKTFVEALKSSKVPYVADYSPQTWNAILADAQEKEVAEQKDNFNRLTAIVSNMRTGLDLESAKKAIDAAFKGGFVNVVQMDKIQQDFETAAKKVKSLMKFEGMRNGSPTYAAAVPAPEEEEAYSDYWDKLAAQHQVQTGAPMPWDQLIREQLQAGALCIRTKAQINKLLDAPAVKGADGSLDVSTVEQGLAALRLIRGTAPSYYTDNYIIDRDKRLSEKAQVAVALTEAGIDRREAATLMSQIDQAKLAEAKEVLRTPTGEDRLNLAFALKDASGINLSRLFGVGFEVSTKGQSRKAEAMAENLFKVYYSTLNIADDERRVKEAKRRAVEFVSQRFEKAKVNGVRYHIERGGTPVSRQVLEEAFDPFATAVADALQWYKQVESANQVEFDFDGRTVDATHMHIPITFRGVPTPYRIAYPLDAAEQKRYRQEAYKVGFGIVEKWLGKESKPAKELQEPAIDAVAIQMRGMAR